ncbi:MAG: hypothetical protein F6K19_00690 [Cyanothece sp. SIO1E1]|nr:hypothetical protein [Cyanothece sp. SIO1E1]
MKRLLIVAAGLMTATLGTSQTAKATEMALDFELPAAEEFSGATLAPVEISTSSPSSAVQAAAEDTSADEDISVGGIQPLAIPAAATNPPIAKDVDISQALATLPPPPPEAAAQIIAKVPPEASNLPLKATQPEPLHQSLNQSSKESPNELPTLPPKLPETPSGKQTLGLHFDVFEHQGADPSPKKIKPTPEQSEPAPNPSPAEHPSPLIAAANLFKDGAESLVARAVGSAEGTRTPDGHRNPAYYGHVDPGNGVWNLGSFSYQHGADSPEEADVKQLKRLQRQTQVLRQKAEAKGLKLSLEEELNGIDLANQAPLAALGKGGYVDWLAEARKIGLRGPEAVLWARTRSFLDPDTKRWNAPGLGNTVHSISHDQDRRMQAIARALDSYQGTPTEGTADSNSQSNHSTSESPNPNPQALSDETLIDLIHSSQDMMLLFELPKNG